MSELPCLGAWGLITDQNDVLRDKGIAYANQAGGWRRAHRDADYDVTNHNFVMVNGLKDSPSAVEARAHVPLRLW